MNHNIRPVIFALMFIFLLPAIARAQSAIEKITQSIEDNPVFETSIYRERRDPQTHKVISSELIVSFTDEKMAKRIMEAFKKERQNATSYSVDNSAKKSGNRFYQIEFRDKKGMSSYSLIFSRKWTFSAKISTFGNHDNTPRTKGRSRGRSIYSSYGERATEYVMTGEDGNIIKVYLNLDYDDGRDIDIKDDTSSPELFVSVD